MTQNYQICKKFPIFYDLVSKEKEFLSTFTENIENVALIEPKNFSDSYIDFVINSKSNGK